MIPDNTNDTPEKDIPNELGLITLEKGAEMLNIGIATFKKHIEEGRIPSVGTSDKLRMVRKQDVADFVNNQIKKPESNIGNTPTSDISKVEEQIQLKRKEQELEALNAGFKTAIEFKQALEELKKEKQEFDQRKVSYEVMVKELEDAKEAFKVLKLKEETILAQGKSQNANDAERVKNVGAEYKKKWAAEDAKRQNENKLMVINLDELAKTVYNMHPQYIGKFAKEKLAEHLEPVLKYYGIPPVFNEHGEYVSLSSRLELIDTDGLTSKHVDEAGTLEEAGIDKNIKQAYEYCIELYNWAKGIQGCYQFANWFFKKLRVLEVLLHDKTPDEIQQSIDMLMQHFGEINRELVSLAGKFDKSNNPNTANKSPEFDYILSVSDEIERLLGVRSGSEE